MDGFIELEIQYQIQKCIKVYGLEGTLEVIERVYSQMPTLRLRFLEQYYRIIHEVK